jgi:hypothetical protein
MNDGQQETTAMKLEMIQKKSPRYGRIEERKMEREA